jgi:hypothetical protein
MCHLRGTSSPRRNLSFSAWTATLLNVPEQRRSPHTSPVLIIKTTELGWKRIHQAQCPVPPVLIGKAAVSQPSVVSTQHAGSPSCNHYVQSWWLICHSTVVAVCTTCTCNLPTRCVCVCVCVCVCAPYHCYNKQRLFPWTTLTDCYLHCLLCGRKRISLLYHVPSSMN